MHLSLQSFAVPIPLERWMIAAIGLSAFAFGWMAGAAFAALARQRERRRRLVETLHRFIASWYQQARELCAGPADERRAEAFALVQSRLILPDLLIHLDEAMRLRPCRRLAGRVRAFLDHVTGGAGADGAQASFVGTLDRLFDEVSAEALRLAK
jgi:hypothetical protein